MFINKNLQKENMLYVCFLLSLEKKNLIFQILFMDNEGLFNLSGNDSIFITIFSFNQLNEVIWKWFETIHVIRCLFISSSDIISLLGWRARGVVHVAAVSAAIAAAAAAVAVVADVVVVACYTNSSLDHVRDTKWLDWLTDGRDEEAAKKVPAHIVVV